MIFVGMWNASAAVLSPLCTCIMQRERFENGNNDSSWRGRLVKAACPLFTLKLGDFIDIAAHTHRAYSPQETINYVTSFDLKLTNYVLPHSPPSYRVVVAVHIFTNDALFIQTYAWMPLFHIFTQIMHKTKSLYITI
jgi:hypothetical protein